MGWFLFGCVFWGEKSDLFGVLDYGVYLLVVFDCVPDSVCKGFACTVKVIDAHDGPLFYALHCFENDFERFDCDFVGFGV